MFTYLNILLSIPCFQFLFSAIYIVRYTSHKTLIIFYIMFCMFLEYLYLLQTSWSHETCGFHTSLSYTVIYSVLRRKEYVVVNIDIRCVNVLFNGRRIQIGMFIIRLPIGVWITIIWYTLKRKKCIPLVWGKYMC